MVTPPVHHPRDSDHERRVTWGLALVTLGSILPLTAPSLQRTLWSSMFCRISECAVLAGDPAYLTHSYVRHTHHPHAVDSLRRFGIPAGGRDGLVVDRPGRTASGRRGGVLCAVRAIGLVLRRSRCPAGLDRHATRRIPHRSGHWGSVHAGRPRRDAFTAELAAGGGILFWTGLTLVALTGVVPVFAPLVYSPVLVCFLLVCAGPLSWFRTHVLFALSVLTLGLQPWKAITATSARPDYVSASLLAPPPPLAGVAELADVALLTFGGIGALAVLTAVLVEIAFQLSPSMADRVTDEVPG